MNIFDDETSKDLLKAGLAKLAETYGLEYIQLLDISVEIFRLFREDHQRIQMKIQ